MIAVTEALRDARGPWEKKAALVYSRYEKRLRETGAVDFDDLLLLVVRLLARDAGGARLVPGALALTSWSTSTRTRTAPSTGSSACSPQEHRNLCVVGDPDQSIYKWRGADIRNILDFERRLSGHRGRAAGAELPLDAAHPGAAAAVIAHNVQRKDKTLWTENAAGRAGARLPRVGRARGGRRSSPSRILALRGRGRAAGTTSRSSTARTPSRACSRTRCGAPACPTSIVGGVRFYERRRSRTCWPTCGSSLNPADDVAFRRAIGAPARGIGATTLARLDEESRRAQSRPLLAAAPSRRPTSAARRRPRARGVRGADRRALRRASGATCRRRPSSTWCSSRRATATRSRRSARRRRRRGWRTWRS